jgi:hypothetical protein
LEHIAANATIFVDFKVIGSTEEPDNLISVEDIDWTAENLEIDVTDKEIAADVFDKIATGAPIADKFVTFVTANGKFQVPYGSAGTFSGERVKLSILPLASGEDYVKLLALYGNDVNAFKAYSVQLDGVNSLPANTKITLDLGGFSAEGLNVYEYNGILLIKKASGTEAFGYENEKILVCAASDGAEEKPESDEDSSVTVSVAEDDTDSDASEDSEEGGNGTLIVVLVIVLVAVLGAAALFVVKWRQEKF